jgi:hypothetical protein
MLNEVFELLVWSNGVVGDIEIIENMSLSDFINYRNMFKPKYEAEAENKKKFIENTFEFARKGIEVICKTIAGAFGTKAGKIGAGKK